MRRIVKTGALRAACAVVVLSLAPAAAPAQDVGAGDDAEARRERLARVIETAVRSESTRRRPSVLGDHDPRRASAADRKAAAVLRTTPVTLSFDGAEVSDAVETLRQVSGLTFVVSARARRALEENERRVTMTVADLPLENALNLLALLFEDLRFTVRYGAVFLVHDEEYRPRRELRVYDVSDLVRPRPDFRAPRLGLGGLEEAEVPW